MESMRWGMEDFPLDIKVSENLDNRSQALIGSLRQQALLTQQLVLAACFQTLLPE
jgi:hypothetical protein